MPELTCPVCGGVLHREERSLRCGAGHCYDIARQGYVNLLRSNQSKSKRHGDDKRMVAARTAFLDAGYYAPLRDAVAAAAARGTIRRRCCIRCSSRGERPPSAAWIFRAMRSSAHTAAHRS